ncbi:hypothetical protein PVAP13_5NG128700 [Panicum virgatum]|uniref:Uncharacterized protein n=1 Tax=Panicum virgatum TaxID=38727 RepID=A0A8T0RRT9_PANVG|nr:hypothetical protein PVAP13_5NG128700 [Panicum virgatum]
MHICVCVRQVLQQPCEAEYVQHYSSRPLSEGRAMQ